MTIDFNKGDGLLPVIIQEDKKGTVLMLGYMNEEAYVQTQETKRVTFFSRSKQRLWVKGEASGNYLEVKSILIDCDQDTLLIKVEPNGPTCHTGTESCFGKDSTVRFIDQLEDTINQRITEEEKYSYTYELYQRGVSKVAQKVGEEAVEVVIEAMGNNVQLFKEEAADLLYHYLVLLRAKEVKLSDIEAVLKLRG